MSVSVLIIDDHDAFRATASDLLRTRGFAVAGHAADRRQAIRAMRRLRPAAVLLDVHLPDGDDLSLVRQLRRLRTDARVLLTSSDPDATTDEQARRHGAVGFVAKTDLASTDLGRFFTSDGEPDGPSTAVTRSAGDARRSAVTYRGSATRPRPGDGPSQSAAGRAS